MISRKELFAEISNEAVTEDGEVVGYFVKNSRMNLLEQMLCSTVTVKLPENKKLMDAPQHIWLQTFGEWPVEYCGELTWSDHPQHADDTLYVRADIICPEKK